MARKRNAEPETRLAGAAAPAREKTKTTRAKHTAKSNPETLAEAVTAVEPMPQELASDPAASFAPSTDEIAALAYSYWEERGYQTGSPEEDWLRAEAELRARRS